MITALLPSGSFSFDCIGGDAIGFAVNSTDGAYGEAFLTITNFTITSNGGMLPEDITVECDEVPVATELSASDNCSDVSVDYLETREDGSCPDSHTLTRVWTATDDCGNATIHTQTIAVEDTTAPEFTSIPADYTAECTDELIYDDASAIDNCGEVSISVLTKRLLEIASAHLPSSVRSQLPMTVATARLRHRRFLLLTRRPLSWSFQRITQQSVTRISLLMMPLRRTIALFVMRILTLRQRLMAMV